GARRDGGKTRGRAVGTRPPLIQPLDSHARCARNAEPRRQPPGPESSRTEVHAPAHGRRSFVRAEIEMAEITAAMLKQLRDQTGAGMMECKAALTEANGDMEEAVTLLRKRGLA